MTSDVINVCVAKKKAQNENASDVKSRKENLSSNEKQKQGTVWQCIASLMVEKRV